MKKILKVVVFISIFIIILHLLDVLFNPTGTEKEWNEANAILEFYKQNKNTIDVMYFGNSSVYSGISPMEIYQNTGITSYTFSTPGQKVWSSYYLIKETLKTQSPKIIFLDVGEFFSNKDSQDELNIRRAIDPLKFSFNKIEMIMDNVYGLSFYDKLSCIIPAIRYHSRVDQLDEADFRKFLNTNDYTYKGYILEDRVNAYNNSSKKNKKNKKKSSYSTESEVNTENVKTFENNNTEFSTEVSEKLYKIIKLCDEKNIKLVLLNMPSPKTWQQEKSDTINDFADKESLEYIDLNTDENVSMDWQKDSEDGGDHLNIYGAEKVGKYLSDYLLNNYSLENHKNDEKYSDWNTMLEKYNLEKENKKINN